MAYPKKADIVLKSDGHGHISMFYKSLGVKL